MAARALFFRDIANVTMDLNDVETIEFNALGGVDNILVNDLTGTDVKRVDDQPRRHARRKRRRRAGRHDHHQCAPTATT